MPAIFIIVIVSLFISHRPSHGGFAGPFPITSSLLHNRARRCLNLASPHRSVVVFFRLKQPHTALDIQFVCYFCQSYFSTSSSLLFYYFRLLWLSSPHPAWTLIYNSCITTTEKKAAWSRAHSTAMRTRTYFFFLFASPLSFNTSSHSAAYVHW